AWEEVPAWAQGACHALLIALRERDPYTFGHCLRVSRMARFLAHSLGLSPHEQKVAELTGLFHDVGKIGIPDSVLLKPGRLTHEEIEIIKADPIKSADIVRPMAEMGVPVFGAMIDGILHHHERLDGKGYPFGVEGSR